jgi:hypothetical protein
MSVYLTGAFPTSVVKRRSTDAASMATAPSIFRGSNPEVRIVRYYEGPDGSLWEHRAPGLPLFAVDRIGGDLVDYRAPRPTESDPSLVLVAAQLESWHATEGRYTTETLRFGAENYAESEEDAE